MNAATTQTETLLSILRTVTQELETHSRRVYTGEEIARDNLASFYAIKKLQVQAEWCAHLANDLGRQIHPCGPPSVYHVSEAPQKPYDKKAFEAGWDGEFRRNATDAPVNKDENGIYWEV